MSEHIALTIERAQFAINANWIIYEFVFINNYIFASGCELQTSINVEGSWWHFYSFNGISILL